MAPPLGQIRLSATPRPPPGWVFCEGQLQPLSQRRPLFAAIGARFGGDGRSTLALPALRLAVDSPLRFLLQAESDPPPWEVPPEQDQRLILGPVPGEGWSLRPERLGPVQIIEPTSAQSAAPLLGEVRLWVAEARLPGWLPCEGDRLSEEDGALRALLCTEHLPDLRAHLPAHPPGAPLFARVWRG
jgi:microcystin-dependent protein